MKGKLSWVWGCWFENNHFCRFWPNLDPHFGPKKAQIWNSLIRMSFQSLFDPKLPKISPYIIQIVFLANSAFNFYSGISTHYFVLVNVYLMQNIKKTHWNTSFSLFSHIVPNFAPQTTPNLLSLVDFQSHMLGDSININNLCCNPV